MKVILFVTSFIVLLEKLSSFPSVTLQDRSRDSLPSQQELHMPHTEHALESRRPKRGVFNLIPQRPLTLKDLLKSSLKKEENLGSPDHRAKRGVFNLIPKSDMSLAKLVAFEDMMLTKVNSIQLSEHKKKSHNRRRLMRLLRNILKEELQQSKK